MTITVAPQTTLERRYRRLLACYPTAYRTEYGEEMIGVLLASTPADQDRPTKAAAFDLIGGGLRARFRLLRTGDGDSPWRNTLAVFSVIAPVLVFATVAEGLVTSYAFVTKFDALTFRYNNRVEGLAIAAAIGLAAVVICPLLARRGRAAAKTGTAIAILAIVAAVAVMFQWLVDYGPYTWDSYLGLMFVVEMVALIASPGPGRGWQLLGRKGLVLLIATVAVLAVSTGLHLAGMVRWNGTPSLWNLANAVDDTAPVVGITLIAVTLRWPAGGRLLALFAIPGYLLAGWDLVERLLTYVYPRYWQSDGVTSAAEYLPTIVIAALVGTAAWRSSRRRRPQVPGSTG